MSLAELAKAARIAKDHAEHHCNKMEAAGVLEVVSVVPGAAGEGEEPSYFFPQRLEAATLPTSPPVPGNH